MARPSASISGRSRCRRTGRRLRTADRPRRDAARAKINLVAAFVELGEEVAALLFGKYPSDSSLKTARSRPARVIRRTAQVMARRPPRPPVVQQREDDRPAAWRYHRTRSPASVWPINPMPGASFWFCINRPTRREQSGVAVLFGAPSPRPSWLVSNQIAAQVGFLLVFADVKLIRLGPDTRSTNLGSPAVRPMRLKNRTRATPRTAVQP